MVREKGDYEGPPRKKKDPSKKCVYTISYISVYEFARETSKDLKRDTRRTRRDRETGY